MSTNFNILIAYTKTDNENQWVTKFKVFLEKMLYQINGVEPTINLTSSDDHFVEQDLLQYNVFVPILSSNYIESGNLLDLVESYVSVHQLNDAGISKSIYKIVKSKFSLKDQPSKLVGLLGYDFYALDDAGDEINEFDDYFSKEAEKTYWMKMVDLAYDIYEGSSQNQEEENEGYKQSIYLANTGYDLNIQKNIIRRELVRHGYQVLPNKEFSSNLVEIEKQIKEDLDKCSLSIHLVGNSYGEIPIGADKSLVDIQNKIATEISITKNEAEHLSFQKLIWINPKLSNLSERQSSFLDNLKRDTTSLENTEILQTPLEDFKNILREELIEVRIDKGLNLRKKQKSNKSKKKSVYLICDKVDKEATGFIRDAFTEAGYDVLYPTYEGELLVLRQIHINNLRNMDVAIIYKGQVNDQWVRMKLLDLLKSPGFGRTKPMMGKAIVVGQGANFNNALFRDPGVDIIEGTTEDQIQKLAYFVNSINKD